MPFFTSYLDSVANEVFDAAGVIYLHTVEPTDADPTNGRTSAGGGAFENGLATVATDWTDANDGDVQNSVAFAFGVAAGDVGTVTHLSYYKGGVPVGFVTLPITTIADTDSFTINANSLLMMGSST